MRNIAFGETMTRNFKRSEFKCKCGCGADQINEDLVRRLQEVRDLLGEPMRITSGVRCEKHNASPDVGGSPSSSHVPDNSGIAHAVDVSCNNSAYRERLLKAVLQVFDRVGIAKSFIHMDVDPNKTAGVVWVY
tara:strand:- start:2134 stop:2532 length:399 start_codon:yes stop_codon:yes gene_type:complete